MSKPGRYYRPIDGILLLDKALGVSSNAALQQVRALFNAAKAGHAGSLDPLASGLLPVCFGQATKVCGRLLSSGKTYRVLVQLGARTESGDGETEVIERAAVPPLDDRAVEAVLAAFLGEQQQVPPMHSALKFEGKRLYELARRGESVEREPRKIVIHRIARVRLEGDELEFDVYCSKGTYIRTLAADIATRLGTIGYVRGLRRLSLDPFNDLPMYTLERLTALAAFLGPQQQVPPMHSALKFEGKRLYELARRGESVEREPRAIVIHRIARVRLEGDELEFDVYCSKGTYIRTLAADIAAGLGTIGYVRGLRRLSLDPFDDLPMYTLEQLTGLSPEARDALLLQADRAFLDLPQVDLADDAVAGLLQGRTVAARQRAAPGELRAYDGRGRFLGMVQGAPDGRVQPVRLFVDVAGG